MKKFIFVFITIIAIAAHASILSRHNNIKLTLPQSLHLPQTAQVTAEGQNLIVFTNVDSIYDNGMDAVTLWIYRPISGKIVKVLTTNPNGKYECLGYGDKAKKVSLTSIPTITSFIFMRCIKLDCKVS